MGKLSGAEIAKQHEDGRITIYPYKKEQLGPNGYDVTLNNKLLRIKGPLDMRLPCDYDSYTIPPEGIMIYPGELWLGVTNEVVGSDCNVPMYEGRSSIGRLGLETHICAGAGDVGFVATWTLEIRATNPIRIYADVRVGQIMFDSVSGEIVTTYKNTGRYNLQTTPQPSLLWKDFIK